MSALYGANRWLSGHSQVIALAGAALAVAGILVRSDFFLRPGLGDVLRALSYHLFVLALLLVLTARSRTVSLPSLGISWLLGVWSVYLLAYLLQRPFGALFGSETSDTFVPVYWAPFVEEMLKLAPVAVFLLVAGYGGRRQPAMTDGLLLGFVVGAGVSFQESAHADSLFLGYGWREGLPWTFVFPTVAPVEDIFALNHAVWAALSGLAFGAAVMFRHRPWTRAIAIGGLLLSLTNHMMVNHFLGNAQGALGLLGRADVPWIFSTTKDLTAGGRLPMLVLIVGAIGAATLEWRMLRSIERRDELFPPIPAAQFSALVKKANSRRGFGQLVAAERYLRLRRMVYFAGWRATVTRAAPEVTYADVTELRSLRARAGAPPAAGPVPSAPVAETPPVGTTGTPLVPALEASPPASGAAVPGVPLIPAAGDDPATT